MKPGHEDSVYEVFARFGDAPAPITWVGSVRAPDPQLAWHAAKEIYTRREQCTVLWIARRSGMVFSTTDDLTALGTADRLGYRKPAFPIRHRKERERHAATVAGGMPRPRRRRAGDA